MDIIKEQFGNFFTLLEEQFPLIPRSPIKGIQFYG